MAAHYVVADGLHLVGQRVVGRHHVAEGDLAKIKLLQTGHVRGIDRNANGQIDAARGQRL